MAKKAKLDVLDVSIDDRIKESIKNEIDSIKDKEDMSSENRTGGNFAFRARICMHKPLFWIILISFVSVVSIMGISIRPHDGQDSAAPVMQSEQTASKTIIPPKEETALLTGFVVDLRDGKEDVRIAFCDIALEPEKPQSADAIRNHAETRSLIYRILKSKKAEELLSKELRIGLKAELKNGLNGLLGENAIKNVYFSYLEVI